MHVRGSHPNGITSVLTFVKMCHLVHGLNGRVTHLHPHTYTNDGDFISEISTFLEKKSSLRNTTTLFYILYVQYVCGKFVACWRLLFFRMSIN
jgi:hypothetical protein